MASPYNFDVSYMDSPTTCIFRSAMKGEWENVVDICRNNPQVYKKPITISGDTALHLAVRDGQENTLEEMVKIIPANERKEALSIANEQGNTALHIAAAIGNARICYFIAGDDRKELVGLRNKSNETPFFLAALCGKRDAFLGLHCICGPDCRQYYRKGNYGDTILHVAIEREYFGLALEIVMLYGELAYSMNQEGISPLHILATKPTAFKSGTHLGGYRRFIYHCTLVDEIMEVNPEQCLAAKSTNNKNKPCFPENYETCMNFFLLPKKIIQYVMRNRPVDSEDAENQRRRPRPIPANYYTCFDILKFVSKAMLVILGFGSSDIRKLREKKEKHTWSVQILDELLDRARMYEYDRSAGKNPDSCVGEDITEVKRAVSEGEKNNDNEKTTTPPGQDIAENREVNKNNNNTKNQTGQDIAEVGKENKTDDKTGTQPREKGSKGETVILIAAKNGITEIVEKILERYPVAIHDMNSEKKNVVLLAVENRQPQVYELLVKRNVMRDSIFRQVDDQGNSALHLAAMLKMSHEPWRIPGAALQMQWEFKWYEFVKNSMPRNFFVHHNCVNQSPKDLFSKTHKELVEHGGKWLTNTSESCSVVAALIATVAFATSATVPGGVNQEKGTPTLEKHPAFDAFAISSLIALCFSVTAVVMFLSILTSRYQEKDFFKDLPRKLLVGLSSLFISISAMLVSFCAGHFFVLKDELKYAALPVYTVTCLPVTLFAIAQFPLYVDLVWTSFKKVPQRSYIAVN